ADIDIVGGKYETALGMAAFMGNESIVRLLLNPGTDINIMGGRCGTALGVAIVLLLLDLRADINVMGGKYETALGVAAYFGKEAIVSLLLD
ncbi:ankyrin repeat-containing domain protein, partial [Tirmania nivea]